MLRAPLLAALLGAICTGSLWAQDAATRGELIASLLEEGWDSQYDTLQIADAYRAELVEGWPHDEQSDFAYSLALVKQRRYHEAIELLDVLAQRESAPPIVWRMLIWLEMAVGQCDAALARFEPLAERIATDENLDAREAEELARFLGRMAGYAQGPAADDVSPAHRETQVRRVLDLLDLDHVRLFEEELESVADQYAALTADSAASRQQATQEAEDERQAREEELAQRRVAIGEELAGLEEHRQQFSEAAGEALEEVDEAAVPLQAELAAISSRAAVPRQQALEVSVEMQRVRQRITDSRNDSYRASLRTQLYYLERLYIRYHHELQALQQQAAGVESQLMYLAQRRTQIQGEYQQQLQALARQASELQEETGRLERRGQLLDRHSQGDYREARALATRAGSLSNYDELPLDALKADLLAELRSDGR